MSAKEEAPAEAAEAAPKKSKKKLIIIVVAVLLLAAGIGVPMFLGGKKAPAEGEAAEAEHVEESKLEVSDLGTFVVNLSESSSFLKVTLKMQYDATALAKAAKEGGEGGGGGHGGGGSGGEGEAKGGMPHELLEREPMIRDSIIRILSSKKTDDVLSAEGKEKLKEELVEGLNEATGLEEPVVTNVFFTDFIVQ